MSASGAVTRMIHRIAEAGPWPVRPGARSLLNPVSVAVSPRDCDPFVAKRKGEWYLHTLIGS